MIVVMVTTTDCGSSDALGRARTRLASDKTATTAAAWKDLMANDARAMRVQGKKR